MPPPDARDPIQPPGSSQRPNPSLLAWGSVAVRIAARGPAPERAIAGSDRLALLYVWYRDGRAPQYKAAEVVMYDVRGAPLASPRSVDWSGFPWADAVAAVTDLGTRRGVRIATPLSAKVRG
jgi:hypothetical protein